jgi:hypothetical protein
MWQFYRIQLLIPPPYKESERRAQIIFKVAIYLKIIAKNPGILSSEIERIAYEKHGWQSSFDYLKYLEENGLIENRQDKEDMQKRTHWYLNL